MKGILGFLRAVVLFPLNVFMTATTDQTGGALATRPAHAENRKFIMKSNLITIPAGGATNDIIKALPIKKGWLVKGTREKIITAGVGTAIALDIGITGGTVDGFDAAIDGTAAAGTTLMSTPSDTYPAAGGYVATADGTIDIKLKTITAMTKPTTIQIFAEIEDLN